MTGHEYRELRLAAGLTQTELARRLDVRRQTIGERERAATVSREAELALRWVRFERMVGKE